MRARHPAVLRSAGNTFSAAQQPQVVTEGGRQRRRTSSMRTIYGSEDARRLRWCRPTGLQASLPCVVVAKSGTQQFLQQFRHPGPFWFDIHGKRGYIGMCSQSAPPICIAASQLRRVRVTYNKLTLMLSPPPPPPQLFRTEKQLTAPADRPIHAVAGALAGSKGAAAGYDRNGPESPPANSPSQNRPPTSPVNHIRCSADPPPRVAL